MMDFLFYRSLRIQLRSVRFLQIFLRTNNEELAERRKRKKICYLRGCYHYSLFNAQQYLATESKECKTLLRCQTIFYCTIDTYVNIDNRKYFHQFFCFIDKLERAKDRLCFLFDYFD